MWDIHIPTVVCRGANEGQSIQGELCGCSDGTLRQMASMGTEAATAVWLTPAWDKGDTRASAKFGDCYIEKGGA